MRYPAPRTVRMGAGTAPAPSSFLRRCPTCTSITLKEVSPCQTLSASLVRVTTRPAWRISTARMANSVGVRSITWLPRVTRRVTRSRVRSSTQSRFWRVIYIRYEDMDASQLVEGGSFMQTALQCASKELVVLKHLRIAWQSCRIVPDENLT